MHILLHINQKLRDVILQNIQKVCKEQTTILNFYPQINVIRNLQYKIIASDVQHEKNN